eukprot:31141-Pelagococcus_subviridis.AAC.3
MVAGTPTSAASIGSCPNAFPNVPCAGDRSLYPPAWRRSIRPRVHASSRRASAPDARAGGVRDDEIGRAVAGELSARVKAVELGVVHRSLARVRRGEDDDVPESSSEVVREFPAAEHATVRPQPRVRAVAHRLLLRGYRLEVRRGEVRHGRRRRPDAAAGGERPRASPLCGFRRNARQRLPKSHH